MRCGKKLCAIYKPHCGDLRHQQSFKSGMTNTLLLQVMPLGLQQRRFSNNFFTESWDKVC